jgi:hypothetical protein
MLVCSLAFGKIACTRRPVRLLGSAVCDFLYKPAVNDVPAAISDRGMSQWWGQEEMVGAAWDEAEPAGDWKVGPRQYSESAACSWQTGPTSELGSWQCLDPTRFDARGKGAGQRRMERRREEAEVCRASSHREKSEEAWRAHSEAMQQGQQKIHMIESETTELKGHLQSMQDEAKVQQSRVCQMFLELAHSRAEVAEAQQYQVQTTDLLLQARLAIDAHKQEAEDCKSKVAHMLPDLIHTRHELMVARSEQNEHIELLTASSETLSKFSLEIAELKATKDTQLSELTHMTRWIHAALAEKFFLAQEVRRLTAITSDPRVAEALAESRSSVKRPFPESSAC